MMRGALVLGLTAFALAGCVRGRQTALKSLDSVLDASWHQAALPGGNFTPGSIVMMNPGPGKTVDLTWLGTLADCNVPAANLSVVPNPQPQMTGVVSVGGGLQAAVLRAVNISVQGKHQVTLTINKASQDSLNFVKFMIWTKNKANEASFANTCGWLTTDPRIFIIQEAFVVSDGSFDVMDSGGAQIQISSVVPPAVPKTASAVSAVVSGKAKPAVLLSAIAPKTTASAKPPAPGDAVPNPTPVLPGQPCAPAPAPTAAPSGQIGGNAERAFCVTVSQPITFAIRGMRQVKGIWEGALFGAPEPVVDPLAGKAVRAVNTAAEK